MRKIFLAAAALAAVTAASPAWSATEIDRIVAVVGQRAVTLSELQTEMVPAMNEMSQRLRGEELASAAEKLRKNTLNSLVDKYIQLQEAKLQGIEVEDSEVDAAINDMRDKNGMSESAFVAALAGEGYTLDDYKASIKEQLMIMKLVNRTVRSKVSLSEVEIQEYYNTNSARFSSPDVVRIASISFPAGAGGREAARKKAEEARAEIMAGTSFEDMAVKCTGNPGAASSCVLGDFTRGELSPAVEEAAFKMKEGDVSAPIENEKGYQLIKITGRTEPGVKPLDQVMDAVVDELSRKKSEGLYAKWIQELRQRTYVDVRDSSF